MLATFSWELSPSSALGLDMMDAPEICESESDSEEEEDVVD